MVFGVHFDEIVRKIIFRRVKKFHPQQILTLFCTMYTGYFPPNIKSKVKEQKHIGKIKIDDLFVVLVILNWANYQYPFYWSRYIFSDGCKPKSRK